MTSQIEPQAERVQDQFPSITSVQIKIVDCGSDHLVGWASLVLADSIRVANIAIRRGRDNQLFCTYPVKRTERGAKTHYFHPISTFAAQAVQDAILSRL